MENKMKKRWFVTDRYEKGLTRQAESRFRALSVNGFTPSWQNESDALLIMLPRIQEDRFRSWSAQFTEHNLKQFSGQG